MKINSNDPRDADLFEKEQSPEVSKGERSLSLLLQDAGDQQCKSELQIRELTAQNERLQKELLRESEERYRIFINSSEEMVFLKDQNYKYLIVNTSYVSFFNRSEDEIIGKSDFDLMEERVANACYHSDQMALRSDQISIQEEQIGERIYETRKFRVLLKDGYFGIGGFIRDITESRLAENALRESEGLFADLISNQIAGVYRIIFKKGEEGQPIWEALEYEFVSERYCDILGVERTIDCREAVSLSLSKIHPEDLHGFIIANEEANRSLHPFSWEGRIIVNQVTKWVRFDSKPRRLNDGSVRWTGVVIETTLHKIAEDLLIKNRNRLMRLNECLSSLGPDSDININRLTALCGELLYATFAMYNRLENGLIKGIGKWHLPDGFVVRNTPEGQICYDVIQSNREEVFEVNNLPATKYAIADPNLLKYNLQTYYGQVVRNESRAVGSLCVVYNHDCQFNDEDRRILGIIGSAIGNEDNRKYRNEALQASELKLKELNATKDKFFSIIAHDLKSPFNGIIGFSAILKEEARNLDTSSIIDYAEMIHYSALQTHRLLENLLSWARMQQGRIPFNAVPNLLHSTANEVINLFREVADRKKITFTNEVPLQLIVQADTEMLKSILRNLISNAIKFTKTKGKVCIKAYPDESGTHIVVEDNGQGIRAEDMDKLFNVGVAFSTRGTENEKGTGLGLILCKEFIEKHGGYFSAESKIGKGSKFKFTLPLV